MAAGNVSPNAQQYTEQDLNDAYSNLLSDLNDAYWAAGDLSAKDQIYGYIEVVTNLITQLNATDLSTRDAAYTALSQQMTVVNGQLKTLQQQITAIINRINTASTIISDIAKALAIAPQVVPGI